VNLWDLLGAMGVASFSIALLALVRRLGAIPIFEQVRLMNDSIRWRHSIRLGNLNKNII